MARDERDRLLFESGEPVAGLFGGLAEGATDRSAPDQTGLMPHSLYRLSVELAIATPLLLCIDDGHLCDGPSLRFLAYLVRRIEDLPVLVVLTARSGEVAIDEEAFFDVVTSPAVEALEPQPLTAAGVAAVIEAGLHVAPDPAFALACHRATGGNPFLTQELVAALAADRIEPAAAAVGRIGALNPTVLSRAVALRLARLPGRALDLARAVAVLGDGAPLHLAAELAGLERSAALEAADVLSAAEVLGPRRTMGANRELEFVHPLVKAALEKGTTGATQRGAHARAARLLAHQGADPARIAGHLVLTDPDGDLGRLPVLREAAALALRQGSPAVAVAYLRRAVAEEPAKPSAVLLIELGAAEAMSGLPEAARTLSRAVEAAVSPEELASAAREHARTLMVSGDGQGALAVRAKAIARLGQHPELVDVLELDQLIGSHANGSVRDKLLARLDRLPAAGQPPTAAQRLTLAVAAIEEAMAGDCAERAASHAVTRPGRRRPPPAGRSRRSRGGTCSSSRCTDALGIRYDAVWRPGTAGEMPLYGVSFEQFKKRYDELWPQGWRLELLQVLPHSEGTRYYAVWRPGTTAEKQVYSADFEQFKKRYDELWPEGWRLQLMER